MAKCNWIREGTEDVSAMQEAVQEAIISEADILGMKDIVEDIEAEFAVRELVGGIVPEKEIDKFIKEKYGEHSERYLLATKILGLITANPIIRDMVHEMIFEFMPAGVTKKGEVAKSPTFGKVYRDKKIGRKQKDLKLLKVQSVSTLKVIYEEALSFAMAGTGNNWGRGVLGRLLTKYYVPRQLAKKERTGAYFNLNKHMRNLHTNIEKNINSFMLDFKVKGKKFKGMKSVYSNIEDMADIITGWKTGKNDRRLKSEIMVEFFTMFMSGEIFYDKKSGKFMAWPDYGVLLDEAGNPRKHDDSGKLMQGFKGTPLTLDKFQKGEYNIPFTKTQSEKFLKQAKIARDIDDRLWKHAKKVFGNSVLKLKKAIRNHFPDLTDGEIEVLFFEEWKIRQHKEVVNKLKKLDKLTKSNYFSKYNYFKNTFGKFASINMFLNQTNDSAYRTNHFPIKYPDQIFLMMHDTYIFELDKKIKDTKKARDKAKGREKTILDNEVKSLESAYDKAVEVRQRKVEGYPRDTLADKEIPIARDHRYLKRITNAYDIRLLRKDSGVYYDYLHDIFSAVERNLLTVTLLDSIGMAKSNAVVDTLTNYYKVPFNDPSVKGGLLFDVSEEGISSALGIANITVSPNVINRFLRRISKFLTGSMLGGIGTAYVNKMALVHTVQDKNLKEVRRALDVMAKHPEEVQNFVAKTAVIGFQDFFSKTLINGKAGFEMDNRTAEKIYAIMLNHTYTKENLNKLSTSKLKGMMKKNNQITTGLSRDDIVKALAEIEMRIQFSKVIKDSPAWNLRITRLTNKKDIHKRLKSIRSNKFDMMLNAFIDFALSKEYEINRYAQIMDWKWQTPANLYKGLGHIVQALGTMHKAIGATMSDGEAWLRTVTLIVGVHKAQDLGYVRPDVNFWELEGDEFRAASAIGKLVSEFSNMGLSTTDMASSGWGGVGRIMQKFNIWPHQKRGRDARIIKYAYIIEKDLKNLGKFNGKAIGKMIVKAAKDGLLFRKWNKLNLAQQQQAQLLKFIHFGVTPALFLDLVLAGPLGSVVIFSALRKFGWAAGLGTGIRGLPSPLAQIISVPLAFALKMAFGLIDDDEEEEDIERFVTKFMRSAMPFGFGPNWAGQWGTLLYYILQEDTDNIARKASEVTGPIVPSQVRVGRDIIKESVKMMLDED